MMIKSFSACRMSVGDEVFRKADQSIDRQSRIKLTARAVRESNW